MGKLKMETSQTYTVESGGVKEQYVNVAGTTLAANQAMRDYVMGETGACQHDATVLIHVSHQNLKAKFMELRMDRHMTILEVMEKLRRHCGTGAESMVLQLFNQAQQFVCILDDLDRKLGFYSPEDGYGIHILDTNPHSMSAGGWLEDVSLVKKYEISEEAYNKREGTVRKWITEKKAADPTWTVQKEMMRRKDPNWVPPNEVTDPEHMAEEASKISVGDRCEVQPGGRRGEVKFVGKVDELNLGFWIGVALDEPVGKTDGSAKGTKYFDCLGPKYGTFARPDKVTVGDFPDLFDEELAELDEI